MWSPTWAGLNIPVTRRCYLSNLSVFPGRKFIEKVALLGEQVRAGFQRWMSTIILPLAWKYYSHMFRSHIQAQREMYKFSYLGEPPSTFMLFVYR